jgi:cytochrome P450
MAEDTTFPFRRTSPFMPPPQYARLRADDPVSRVRMVGGNLAWLIARYDDVRAVLGATHMSVDRRNPGFPRFAEATPGQRDESYRGFRPPMNWMDGAEHTAARRSVVEEYSRRRIEGMRPRIQRIAEDTLDRFLAGGGPADLVRGYAMPVPSAVICAQLGVPYEHHEYFELHATRMLTRATPADERTRSAHGIRAMLDDVVTAKTARPGDDLISRLLARQADAGAPDHEAVVSMAFVLLTAGHVTTANMIALGVLGLLQHPRQLELLRREPERTPAAVDELLRFFSVVDAATSRTATVDTEVAGVTIRAGEGVVALGPAANRDPAVFERPDELDITRPRRRHAAFGFGRHHCIGQHLARVELEVALGTVVRRLPRLRLAVPLERLSFMDDANIYGVHELPVQWS